jgi:hypothetical protein
LGQAGKNLERLKAFAGDPYLNEDLIGEFHEKRL